MRFLITSGIVILLTLSIEQPARAQNSDSWPQFRGNHQLTGFSNSALPERLKLRWTYQAEDAIESSAAIVDGTVYVGSLSGDLIALDLESGREKWRYRADDGIGESSPAVEGEMVYVGDLAGVLHAVNTLTGKMHWTFKTEAEIQSLSLIHI